MTTGAVVQARMGSTRLPGKVMRQIAGRPMIDWVVDRAMRIPSVERVVVATSKKSTEAPLVEHCRRRKIPVYRGPEEDVLARYVGAAESFDIDTVVRCTSDCPLLMPEVSQRVIDRYLNAECDYASNTLERTYPRGLDTEVIALEMLALVEREATVPDDREHVTPYVCRHTDRFNLCSVVSNMDRSDLRWTVDEEADLNLVRRVYKLLSEPMASYKKVLALFDEYPELAEINSEVRQTSV